MIATRTGVNAAEASVPGAQIFEHVYAAAADATAVIRRVVRSMPSRRIGDERVSAWLDTEERLPHERAHYARSDAPQDEV
jgi:hypothetical protein